MLRRQATDPLYCSTTKQYVSRTKLLQYAEPVETASGSDKMRKQFVCACDWLAICSKIRGLEQGLAALRHYNTESP